MKDSGKRTPRGAVIWRAAPGPCPRGYLTPKMADAALEDLLDEARLAIPDAPLDEGPTEDVPTFGDAVDAWLEYLEVEKRRKHSTLRDARNVASGNLLPRFGRDTPLYLTERHEVVVRRNGRQFVRSARSAATRSRLRTSTLSGASCSLGPVAADGPEGPRAAARRLQAREAAQADRE